MCCGGRGDYAPPLKRSSCKFFFAHSCSDARKTFLRQLLRTLLVDRLLVNCLCVSLITYLRPLVKPQNTFKQPKVFIFLDVS